MNTLVVIFALLTSIFCIEHNTCNVGEYALEKALQGSTKVNFECVPDVLRPFVCGERRNLSAGIWDHFHVGAHDAGASRFESLSVHEETPEHEFNFGFLNTLLLNIPQYIIEKVSRAQSKSLGELVESGVTYIDLRVAWSSTHQNWWVLHGYFCYSLDEALASLADGISKTDWPVILEMAIIGDKTKEQLIYLNAKVNSALTKFSVDTSKGWPLLGEVWGKQNRLFLANLELAIIDSKRWRVLKSAGHWPNKAYHTESFESCKEFIRKQPATTGRFVGVQLLVTPTAKSTMWNMLTFSGWSLKHYAEQMLSHFPDFTRAEGIGKLSLVSCDDAHNLTKYLFDNKL